MRWSFLALVVTLVAAAARLEAEPLFAKYGTGTFLHPLQIPDRIRMPACYDQGPCRCCKEHVYIFGVNGLNPMCLGNFNGMLSYFREQGFEHVTFGQLHSSHWFAGKIKEIRRTDPKARIVVIGYSLGANYVRILANQLAEDGCRLDLLVYLAGDLIRDVPSSRPANVDRIVNVRANGLVLLGGDLFFNGAEIEGARNHKLDCRHILTPNRREALELMMEELLQQACFPEVAP